DDGIRDKLVTGVQTCALPISNSSGEPKTTNRAAITKSWNMWSSQKAIGIHERHAIVAGTTRRSAHGVCMKPCHAWPQCSMAPGEIGRASCREREEIAVGRVGR